MNFLNAFVVLFSLGIIVLQVFGIIKATKQDYASTFVTMYRGFSVATLLKEQKPEDERIKKLVILNSSVNILLIAALVTLYFSQDVTGDHVLVIALGTLLINFLTQKLVDWRIKKIVKESEEFQNL
ncbi:hypothetical protein SAMN04488102_11820 [Alkalibacterium subtropicum]|uniref:Uncharacterized protein n=1 Tax=Alkalibacterium subtropicum TaxID=753702 RepID=A0A1I1L567_9LACT|nr:hypothetical protein [Alkalibacterium subtropicum]SFC68151.1 hypothetical protein SAMN04488102_11820 [Alkalibacterium subtropicum]